MILGRGISSQARAPFFTHSLVQCSMFTCRSAQPSYQKKKKEEEEVVSFRLWVWRKGGGGFGRDGEVKRIERVSGLGLKKRGPNMGFESESESVRRSGGLKTDDIGKRDFQSGESSIFHSFHLNLNLNLSLRR